MSQVFAPRPGQVVEVLVQRGQVVAAGDAVLKLTSREIEQEFVRTTQQLDVVKLRLARRFADKVDRVESLVLEREYAALAGKIEGLKAERDELTVIAPIAGRIMELNAGAHAGRWIGRSEPVALITGSDGRLARGYIAEENLWRVRSGAQGRFIPEIPFESAHAGPHCRHRLCECGDGGNRGSGLALRRGGCRAQAWSAAARSSQRPVPRHARRRRSRRRCSRTGAARYRLDRRRTRGAGVLGLAANRRRTRARERVLIAIDLATAGHPVSLTPSCLLIRNAYSARRSGLRPNCAKMYSRHVFRGSY